MKGNDVYGKGIHLYSIQLPKPHLTALICNPIGLPILMLVLSIGKNGYTA